MNEARFEDLPEEEQEWIDAFLNGGIDDDSFAKLQDRMLERPELRTVMRRCLALHGRRSRLRRASPLCSACCS